MQWRVARRGRACLIPQAPLISRARLAVDSGALYSVDTGRPRSVSGHRFPGSFPDADSFPRLDLPCLSLPADRQAGVDTGRRLIPQAPLTGDTGRPLYKSKSAHGEIAGTLADISADYLLGKSTTRYDELQAKSCEKKSPVISRHAPLAQHHQCRVHCSMPRKRRHILANSCSR